MMSEEKNSSTRVCQDSANIPTMQRRPSGEQLIKSANIPTMQQISGTKNPSPSNNGNKK